MGLPNRLTDMQKRFAEFYVFGDEHGPLTKTEAAKRAGYSEKNARFEGSSLTSPKKHPLVVKYIGELRLSMAMAISKLAQADALLNQRLTQKPLCYNQQANQQSKIVNNVFFKFYIGEVQPMLAQLHQQGKAVFGLIDKLQKHMATPDLFTEFWAEVYTAEDSEWQDFNAAIAKHTKSWQDLFNQCGGLPR